MCVCVHTRENPTFLNEVTAGCELISFSHMTFKQLNVSQYPGFNNIHHLTALF